MNKPKSLSAPVQLTVIFYIALFAIPVFSNSGGLVSAQILSFLKTPLNCIFLFSPVIITVFTHKRKSSVLTAAQAIIYIISAAAIYFQLAGSQYSTLIPCIGTLLISVLLVCTNQLAASITLLPGLFLGSLGVSYIFMAYIPTLLFMLIKFSFSSDKESKEKNISFLLLGAYLYVAVFAVLLAIKNRLNINSSPVVFNFSETKNILAFAAGILLVIICLLAFIKALLPSFSKMTVLQKAGAVLFAVYPAVLAVISCFINLLSSDFRSVFLTASLIYVTGFMCIVNTDEENVDFVNTKHIRIFTATAVICFCTLCF